MGRFSGVVGSDVSIPTNNMFNSSFFLSIIRDIFEVINIAYMVVSLKRVLIRRKSQFSF